MDTKFYYKTTKYLTPPERNSAEAEIYKNVFSQLAERISEFRRRDGGNLHVDDDSPYGPGAPGILPTGWSEDPLERSNEMFTDGMKIVRIWHSMENAQNYVNLINSFESPFISAELDDALVESTSLPAQYRAY